MEISSYSKIETQLNNFIGIVLTYIEFGCLGNGTGIAKTLAGVGKKPCSEGNLSSSRVIPYKRTKSELRTGLCIFYGEIHST